MPPFAICKFVSCPDPPLLLTIRRCTPACAVVSDQNGTSRVEQFSAVVTEATDRSVNQLANDCPVAAVFAALRDLRRQMSVCLPDLWPPRPRTWRRRSACAASRSGRMTSSAGHCPARWRRLGSIRQSVPLGILSLWVIGLVSSFGGGTCRRDTLRNSRICLVATWPHHAAANNVSVPQVSEQ